MCHVLNEYLSVLSTAAQQEESQPKPKPQNSDTKTFSEMELVDKINFLRNSPSPRTKDELNLLENLHKKGKAVGYTTVKYTKTFLEKQIRVLQYLPILPTEEEQDKLYQFQDLLEKAEVDGYATVCDGTVFHYGGNWLYTCAHVVRSEDYLKDTTVTLEWRNLDGESEKHTCAPLQGDPSHRIGIFTKITEGGDKIDLAIFQENQINVSLQAIAFKSIITIKDLDPEVPEHKKLIDEYVKTPAPTTGMDSDPDSPTSEDEILNSMNEITPGTGCEVKFNAKTGEFEVIEKPPVAHNIIANVPIPTPISLREDDTLYHIYWNFPKSSAPIATKMFCITKQSTDKEVDSERKEGEDVGPCFPFNSPALKGASGSPVMVYRNIFEEDSDEEDSDEEDSDDDSKRFCLVGVMSEGWRKVQLAQLPESIKQHSNLMQTLERRLRTLDRAESLAKQLRDNTTVPVKWMHTLEQQVQQAKESISDVFQTNDIVGTGQLARSD